MNFFLLPVLLTVVNALSDHKDWMSFKKTYNKIYKNIDEEQHRLKIYKNNVKTISEHNVKYKQGEYPYYMGINKFTDMTEEEFVLWVSKATPKKLQNEVFKEVPEHFKAPESVDWRKLGAVLRVKDQGDCSAGYAFAVAGAIEGQLVIKKNKTIEVSEQEILDCSTENGNGGCIAGYNILAWDYIEYNGIRSDSTYPYEGKTGECRVYANESLVEHFERGRLAESEDALMWAVSAVGPVTVTIYANPLLQHYAGGVYNDVDRCPNDDRLINHGVLVIGYGTETDGQDYWLFKNSWGNQWGENGFFKLGKNPSVCGVVLDITYPED